MKIKKGTLLNINHCRKGKFQGKAIRDFDSEIKEFYPIKLVSKQVSGINTCWIEGEEIPCRKNLCTIEILGERR